MSVEQIMALTGVQPMHVRRIVEDDKIAIEVAKQNFQNKLPIIKDIIGMGLEGIHATLMEMANPEVRHRMITKMQDLTMLSRVMADLHTMLRLEQGQATEINNSVSHSYNETRMVLKELREKDLVFDYPEMKDIAEIKKPEN